MEAQWLRHIHSRLDQSDVSLDLSFSAYYASHQDRTLLSRGIGAMLPLFYERSDTVPMIMHGMKLQVDITKYLNPGQMPVMCGDGPIYTLMKLVQWNYPEQFGEDKFFVMFAGFHIEKKFMEMLGKLLQGSGWTSIMASACVVTETAAESVLRACHVKRARALHEVSAAVLYSLRMDSYASAGSNLEFDQWCEQESEGNPSFKFWSLILNLESMLLTFVHSIRDGNFDMYVETLKKMVPWFFIFNHPHYSRWLPVHLRDLEELATKSPALYEEFKKGNFVMRKTDNPFSALAIDQAHEQHNADMKDFGGVIGLTQDPAALRSYYVCTRSKQGS